jgi:hypothetical protein
MLRSTRLTALAAILGAAALALVVSPALAATQPAAGAFVEAPETILEERQSGGNTFIHLTREVTFTGTYTGVGQADQRIVIHADGSFNVHMTIAFTGVACAQPVALTFLVVGKGDFNENVIGGTYTVIGPAPVGKGHGTFSGAPGVGGMYEGDVHCD